MFLNEKPQNTDQEVCLYCAIWRQQTLVQVYIRKVPPRRENSDSIYTTLSFPKMVTFSAGLGNYYCLGAKHAVSIFKFLFRLQTPAGHCMFFCSK